MQEIDLKNANLSNANFYQSSFPDSDFRGSFSAYTNFSETFLVGSDFGCFNNECAELLGVNFSNANLKSAKFDNASLENVNFNNADLTNVSFKGAKHLTLEQIKTAKICKTQLPAHIRLPENRDGGK